MLQAAAFEQQGSHDPEGITISRVLSSVALHAGQLDALQLDGAQAVRLLLHAAWKAQQLEGNTQQLQLEQDIGHLSVCDVLLLLGVWSDEQWEESAGLILLQGVQDLSNLSQLSQLFRSLSDLTDGAGAQWLLGVGLAWATTCFLDCPVPSSRFQEAGLQLLKAGLIATVDLAEHGLALVLQRLTSEASSKSCLWQVLHFAVNHCMDSSPRQQDIPGQLWQHLACDHHGLQISCRQEHAPQVVQVLTNGLLTSGSRTKQAMIPLVLVLVLQQKTGGQPGQTVEDSRTPLDVFLLSIKQQQQQQAKAKEIAGTNCLQRQQQQQWNQQIK
eukprot:gene5961-6200_t